MINLFRVGFVFAWLVPCVVLGQVDTLTEFEKNAVEFAPVELRLGMSCTEFRKVYPAAWSETVPEGLPDVVGMYGFKAKPITVGLAAFFKDRLYLISLRYKGRKLQVIGDNTGMLTRVTKLFGKPHHIVFAKVEKSGISDAQELVWKFPSVERTVAYSLGKDDMGVIVVDLSIRDDATIQDMNKHRDQLSEESDPGF